MLQVTLRLRPRLVYKRPSTSPNYMSEKSPLLRGDWVAVDITALASPWTESADPDACQEKLTPHIVPTQCRGSRLPIHA